MPRPVLKVADIFRDHGAAWRHANRGHVSLEQLKVMSAIERCRTAALGGHVARCENEGCGHTVIAFNSCRNRHCPKCQGSAAREWLAERQAELLPVPYFHVVYTLPARIADIAYQNKAAIYGILFKASAETTLRIAADPNRLGARIGFISVLHTWGSAMTHHPHVHMLVPGGGLSADGQRWIAGRPDYLLPVPVLSQLFRGLVLSLLQGGLCCARIQYRRRQRSSRALDRADGGREILAQGYERVEGPRSERHPDRRCGRTKGLSGSDHDGLSPNAGPDLHRAPDPQQSCLRHLERPQAIMPWIKAIYQAANADQALVRLEEFEAEWGKRYPAIGQAWRRAWEHVIPFFAFAPAIRKMIYTTNCVEALNRSLRKIIKTRGSFPTDEAAFKLLYLAIQNAGVHWRKPIEWTAAMGQFAIQFGDRFASSAR